MCALKRNKSMDKEEGDKKKLYTIKEKFPKKYLKYLIATIFVKPVSL